MSLYGQSEEHQPVTWWRGHPVYATHFLVGIYVASLLATTLALAFRLGGALDWLVFHSPLVLHGQVWRVLTYGLVNPPSLDFQFPIDLLMMLWFGREVEKFFGRRKFFTLYAGIYLATPLLFTALGSWWPLSRSGETGALALFIAFATLYPNAVLMFDILAKWAALAIVGIFTLYAVAYHDLPTLLSIAATCGFAYTFVRYQQGLLTLPSLRLWPKRRPNLRVLPDLPVKRGAEKSSQSSEEMSMSEVDALLDKIAKSGIGSLTAKERARLEEGRARLLKKESGRRCGARPDEWVRGASRALSPS